MGWAVARLRPEAPLFKLHVYSQTGDLDLHVVIEGDSATIGRSPDCNIVIDRKDISRRHARLLRGWVVDDLASRNGTHVEGVKIEAARSIPSRSFELGDPTGNNMVTIEVVAEDGDARPARDNHELKLPEGSGRAAPDPEGKSAQSLPPTGEFRGVSADPTAGDSIAEQYRFKCVRLEIELEELRRKFESLHATPVRADELAETKAENRMLQQRIDKLKRDAEGRGK